MVAKPDSLLLALIIIAVVIAPLRGAWAFAEPAGNDSLSHCAQMDMPAGEQHPGTAADTGHQCETGCDGGCCDGNCNSCAHSLISLLDSTVAMPHSFGTPFNTPIPASFPHRTPIPPLRPPASL